MVHCFCSAVLCDVCIARLSFRRLCMFSRAQLLLWPSFKLSSFSRASSCVLGDLVFVSRVDTSYAHLCHRTYPLRTSVQASNELSSISSTVSGAQDGDCGEPDTAEHSDDMAEACPSHEVVCWTKLPSFLFSYSPKVRRIR